MLFNRQGLAESNAADFGGRRSTCKGVISFTVLRDCRNSALAEALCIRST